MARGYPDYFGQSIWPKYGTPIQEDGLNGSIPPNTVQTTLEILAQGVLSQLRISINTLAVEEDHAAIVYIDGEAVVTLSLLYELTALTIVTDPSLFELDFYSEDTLQALWTLKREIPFKESVKVTITNANAGGGNDIGGLVRAVYYHVT